MARQYMHISNFEKEILELKEEGLTQKEIGENLGFTREQIKEFLKRYRRKEQKIAAGIALNKKGRPSKDNVVTEDMKIAELKYIIARKDARIKQLEMETELTRAFLKETGRK